MTYHIYNEDALEIVADLGEFDAVLTDPPYPTGGESSMKDPASIKAAREMVDALSQSLVGGVLRSVRRRNDRLMAWLFTDWRQVSYFSAIFRGMGMPSQSCIVWDKMRGSLSSLYHPSHEMILFGSTRGNKPDGYLGRDLVQCKRVSGKSKEHPFSKPPELVETILSNFPAGRILDPFCGTGGLLVGAQRLGWDVVGVEIGKQFAEVAEKRLQDVEI